MRRDHVSHTQGGGVGKTGGRHGAGSRVSRVVVRLAVIVSEQDRFDVLFDLQDSSGHEADRLLLDSVLVEHQALGSGRGHGSGHEQYEMRLRSSAGADVRAFFKPANGLRQRSLEMFGQTRASCVLAEALAWRFAVALGTPYETLVAPCVLRFFDVIDTDAPGAMSLACPGVDESYAPADEVPEQWAAAALFDALSGQQDRHSGNWLWDEESRALHLIDHGYGFACRGDHAANSEILRVRRERGPLGLSDSELGLLGRMLDDAGLLDVERVLSESRARSLRARAQDMTEPPRVILREGSFH